MQKRKQTQHYIFNTRNDFISESNQTCISRDNKYVLKFINHAVYYLDAQNITDYQNFIDDYKTAGCSVKKIQDLIIEFKNYVNKRRDTDSDFKSNLNWINSRNLIKSNCSGKNIIINRLAHEFSNYFVDFSIEYLQKENAYNYDFLKHKLNSKIKILKGQSQNIDQLISTKEQSQNIDQLISTKEQSQNIDQLISTVEMENEAILEDLNHFDIGTNENFDVTNDDYFNDLDFTVNLQLSFAD